VRNLPAGVDEGRISDIIWHTLGSKFNLQSQEEARVTRREQARDREGRAERILQGKTEVITIVITHPATVEGLMTRETTIRAIGNSAGATIPKAMLERYRLSEGDRVHLIETDEGILITPFDPAFAEAMAIYEEGAKKYRNAMRELAK